VGGERGRKAGQLLGILLSYLEDQQRFSNHQTLALAAEVGLTLPDPRSYLDAVLEADFSRL
jgi:hypothetical protein